MSSTSTARSSLPWIALLLLVTVAACGDRAPRTTLGPDGPGIPAASTSLLPEGVEACGETTEVRLMAGQQLEVGVVTVANDEDNLYVTYVSRDGWTLQATHLEVTASAADVPATPTGNPVVGKFSRQVTHDGSTTRHTYTIPRSDLGVEAGDALVVAAHADVYNSSLDRSETAWGEGTRFVENGGSWASYVSFTVQECDDVLEPDELCSEHDGDAVATFADRNLEARVRSTLDVGTDVELTCTMLERIGLLKGERSYIRDLTGIQNLTGLRRLLLDENRITDLGPLSTLTGLTYLRAEDNAVNDVAPLSGLTNLTILHLPENSITDIRPLSGLTELGHLGLTGNSIDDVGPLSTLTELRTLQLGRNAISDVRPLAGLTGLTSLSLSINNVDDISALNSLTKLTQLFLGGNEIRDVSALATMSDLGYLSLGSNAITDIAALRDLPDLWFVALSNNQALTDVTPLIENSGIATGDRVAVFRTAVTCASVDRLEAKGVTVLTDCLGDSDGDGYDARTDCDDTDIDVYPGAPELSDGLDNDCDGEVDEGV